MSVIFGFLSTLADTVAGTNIGEGAEAAILSKHQGSLTMAGSAARVEPKVLIDSNLRMYEDLDKVMKFAFHDFTGYYLSAADSLATIDGVRVYDKLGQLNPNRDLSMLSYSSGPIVHDPVHLVYSKEDFKYSLFNKNSIYSSESDSATKDMFAGGLAIGKVVCVKININDKSIEQPIIIRLVPQYEDPIVLKEIMAKEDVQDKTLGGRIDKARSGQISWLEDFILCKDLNEKKRVLAVKDKNGTYKEMAKRQDKNMLMAMITGKRSLAYASNIALVDSDTLRQIEVRMKGRMSNDTVKRGVFENTALMTIISVDRGMGCVTVYHAGIAHTATYTIKQLEHGFKNESDRLQEVLKAFIGQRPVSL